MRALNRKDARDLLWLLLTLVLMTILLRLALQLLTTFDLAVMDAWLISCLLLLVFKRFRVSGGSRRRRATSRADSV